MSCYTEIYCFRDVLHKNILPVIFFLSTNFQSNSIFYRHTVYDTVAFMGKRTRAEDTQHGYLFVCASIYEFAW